MARTITVAALQTSYGEDMAANIRKTEGLIREAAGRGAQAILPSELFQGHYFCVAQEEKWFATAYPWREHPCVTALAPLAGELGVVLPISIFEREGPHYYNSIVIADADGSLAGIYRKSHIPDGPGYQEKYYFRPGDTGFKVWDTRFGRLGVGICWDQWYPEEARAMALMGAEVLFYPTAIGSEPHDSSLDTRDPWRRVMQGHAVANVMPVVASNRIGFEPGPGGGQSFYGSSFI
ncbi:MAG: nitrilase-related carbon-nitrogen hydrolase, partial [Caulobacteraceae bacterium]